MGDVIGNRPGRFGSLSDTWIYALEEASTEKQVIGAVKDFLATWTPGMLARLPESCRPGKIGGAEDVSDLAFKLSRTGLQFEGDLPDRRLLALMANFFAHASARLAKLVRASDWSQRQSA
jgi:hypothetical protein